MFTSYSCFIKSPSCTQNSCCWYVNVTWIWFSDIKKYRMSCFSTDSLCTGQVPILKVFCATQDGGKLQDTCWREAFVTLPQGSVIVTRWWLKIHQNTLKLHAAVVRRGWPAQTHACQTIVRLTDSEHFKTRATCQAVQTGRGFRYRFYRLKRCYVKVFMLEKQKLFFKPSWAALLTA